MTGLNLGLRISTRLVSTRVRSGASAGPQQLSVIWLTCVSLGSRASEYALSLAPSHQHGAGDKAKPAGRRCLPVLWELRSLRRALYTMVKDDGVIRTGAGGPADPYRCCVNPIIEAVIRAQQQRVT